jgi:hypothetical protein
LHVWELRRLRKVGSLRRAARALPAGFVRKLAISSGLALVALLATADLAAASDPIDASSEALPASSAQTPILEAPEPEPSPSVEVTEPAEASLTVEVTEPAEASLTVEVTEPAEASLTVEVTEPAEASLSVEVAPTPEANVTVEPVVPTPGVGGLPVGAVPPLDAVLAPVTEVVAGQDPVGGLPEGEGLVALPPLEAPSLPGTDAVTPRLIDTIEDTEEVLSSRAWPAVQFLREASELAEPAAAADRPRPSARPPAIDGWVVFAVDGDPAQGDSALATPINVASIPAADEGWYRGGVRAPSNVPRVVSGSGGSAGTSSTDLNPLAAVLAALAAGSAGWRSLALRVPPNPSGLWLAAPVPPG